MHATMTILPTMEWFPATALVDHTRSFTMRYNQLDEELNFFVFLCNLMCNITHKPHDPLNPIAPCTLYTKPKVSSPIYKSAATPIIPATTPVKPPAATWFAAPVN
jgi:hypothetical protein